MVTPEIQRLIEEHEIIKEDDKWVIDWEFDIWLEDYLSRRTNETEAPRYDTPEEAYEQWLRLKFKS